MIRFEDGQKVQFCRKCWFANEPSGAVRALGSFKIRYA
jgi:hypothetical protein